MTNASVSHPGQLSVGRGFFIPATASILVLMVLVLIAPIMTAEGPADGGGNTARQIGYGLLFLFTVGAVGAFKRPRRLLAPPISMIIAIGWCWLSLTWALDPSISVRRIILTTLVFWTIFLAVENCGFDRTIKAIMIALTVILIVNYVAILVSPTTAIHQPGESHDSGLVGDWRGVLPQKNFTGAVCALTILIFGFYGQRKDLFWRLPIITAAGFFLAMTESKTSIGMLGLAALVGVLYLASRPQLRLILVPIVAIAGCAAMLYWIGAWDEALGPFSRRDGLTGRVQIWPYLVNYAQDHPFTGAGYGSFWNIGEASPIYAYSKNWVSTLSSGHNGFLDLLVQVGWPGVILAVLATMVIPLWKLLSGENISRARGALLIGIIVFCIGHNMTETSLFERDVIVGVFLIFAVALTNVLYRRSIPARRSSGRGRPSNSMAEADAVLHPETSPASHD